MNKVLESTRYVVERSKHVRIDHSALEALASQYEGAANWLEKAPWDVHRLDSDALLQFLLVFDATSFSYWGAPKWRIEYAGKEYDGSWALLLCYKRALDEGKPVLNPGYLANLSLNNFLDITRGNAEIPLAAERCSNLREIGKTLLEYGRDLNNVLRGVTGASDAVEKIVEAFPCFKDEATYEGKPVYFHKRAQVLVGDIAHFFHTIQHTEQLTACADYKIPQVLRHADGLQYSSELAEKIDAMVEIPAGSEEEVEIRANTIWAVEYLANALKCRIPAAKAIDVNNWLWLKSQVSSSIKPYHRTRTVAY